jgi:HAD superfamily hydrolase (TIGR01509 family)
MNNSPRAAKKSGFSAVIFDLDGTLIDSEKNYVASDTKLLAKFGIEYTPVLRRRLIGRGIDVFAQILINEYGVKETPEALTAMKDSYYMDVARTNTRVFPEMRKLLDIFAGRGLLLAVASGSSQPVIEELLEVCGVRGFFAAVVSSVGLFPGKPDPAIFRETSRRLGRAPEECFVLEDSPSGVAAALAAGMKVAAVPTLTTPPLDPVMEKATILFAGGMDAFTAEELLAKIESLS